MSRTSILRQVRTSLGVAADDAERRAAVDERIAAPPHFPAPERVAAAGGNIIECFKQELESQLANVVEVSTAAEIPAAIVDYLRANNQPPNLRLGRDPYLAALDFASQPGLATSTGPAGKDDAAGLSAAFAGIAETGTLALLSGPDNPVTLGFLPDTHVIVVPRSRIVATYEDAFTLLRTERQPTYMPRTLNLISGPSRTADIGGRIVIGAHGPRRLLVILANDS